MVAEEIENGSIFHWQRNANSPLCFDFKFLKNFLKNCLNDSWANSYYLGQVLEDIIIVNYGLALGDQGI